MPVLSAFCYNAATLPTVAISKRIIRGAREGILIEVEWKGLC